VAASLLLGVFTIVDFRHSASAETAVLTSDGTLHEAIIGLYRDVVPGASLVPSLAEKNFSVVVLRTTSPSGETNVDVVDGTVTVEPKGLPAIAVDEATGTLVICYSRFQGVTSDLHVAIRRGDAWVNRDIQPSSGFCLSLNPRMTATRQQYLDFDSSGGTVTKSRTILSLIWWEESGSSRARYAPIFVEDGVVSIDAVATYDLNELLGKGGTTDSVGIPLSAYEFPAVASDPSSTTGGVLVVFANLVTHREIVASIVFPNNLTQPPGAQVKAHMPIGRQLGDGPIPVNRDTQAAVGYFVSSTGRATSWWTDATGLRFIRNDAPAGDVPKTLIIRTDFPVDRALSVVREMTLSP
jgi:hypothetical protein